MVSARAAATNAAAGAQRIGNVRLVAQRMSGGMTSADLRSLIGDIRGKLQRAGGGGAGLPRASQPKPAWSRPTRCPGPRNPCQRPVEQLAVAVEGRGGGGDLAQGSGKQPIGTTPRRRRSALRSP